MTNVYKRINDERLHNTVVRTLVDGYIEALTVHFIDPFSYRECDYCARMTDQQLADKAYERTIELIRMLRSIGAIE